jgi:hypothetical protein
LLSFILKVHKRHKEGDTLTTMPRLPKPGSDEGTWGDILNNFLLQAHNSNGSLKPITTDSIANGTITDNDINSSAAIALSKLAVNPLSRTNHTGTQLMATVSDAGTAATKDIDTDSDLAANSDVLIPTQKAVKTQIDGLVNTYETLAQHDWTLPSGATAQNYPRYLPVSELSVNTFASGRLQHFGI